MTPFWAVGGMGVDRRVVAALWRRAPLPLLTPDAHENGREMEPNRSLTRLEIVTSDLDRSTGEPAVSAPASFDELYRAQWASQVRFAALTTGSVATAEEIVQDAFVDLHRRWNRVQLPVAYLRHSVVHGCIGWVRRRQTEHRYAQRELVAPPVHVDAHLVELVDALAVLSPRQRAAVVLRYVDDLSEAEIARALGCRPGTVKSLLSRALATLQEVLTP